MATHCFPAIAIPDEQHVRGTSPIRRQSRRWSIIAFTTFIACIAAAIGGMAWWDEHLSKEEQSILGRWGSIDTMSHTSPQGTSSLTCYRELKFLPGHEVQLRVWTQGDPKRVEMVPFLGGRGYLYPQEAGSKDSRTTPQLPAVLSESLDLSSVAQVNATGQWSIKNGQIEIEWNLDNTLFKKISAKYNEIIHRTQIIYTSKKARGSVTQDRDDQLTINWLTSPSRATHYTHPSQVWTRQR